MISAILYPVHMITLINETYFYQDVCDLQREVKKKSILI